MKPRAKRTDNIANVGAFAIWEKANALEAQGKQIVHLELGEPDFDTPAHIMAAAQEALVAGRTRYGSAIGSPTLRQAIASVVTRTRQINVEASRVMVTQGVKSALFFALLALVESGNEVLIPNPGFPAYEQIVRITEGTPIYYPLSPEHGFQPVSTEIEALITAKTKCLILNSPANPTGTIHTKETLADLATLAQTYDLWVISDEIYYQLHFTAEPPPSIYSLPGMEKRTILCDGFSKPYAMTGWRLGFGIFPAELCEGVATLMVNNHSSLPLFIQDAGVVALEGPQDCVAEMVDTYKKRRDLVVRLLDTIPGIHYTYPDGAFYIMIDVSAITDDVNALAEALLEAGVALLPGASFGSNGEGFLRLAFCQSEDNISWALERVKETICTMKEAKTTSQQTVAEVIADELYQAGVRTVFGQPGGEVVDLMEAMAQRGIEFVLMGLESGAALAAATLGQATGIPGVCLATLGPGACNLTLGIGDAFLDRHPLLAISARTSDEATWYNHQRLDLNALFAPISKASIALDGTNTAAQIRGAVELATTSPRGPVYLSLPSRTALQVEKINHQANDKTPTRRPLTPPNTGRGIERIVTALNQAQRPVVVVGIALSQRKDAAAIREFLALTGLPYADTPKTKGLVDPNGAGFLGTFLSASGDSIINEQIRQSDCILGIGYDPVETTYDWHLGKNYYVITDGPTGFGSFQPPVEAIGDVTEMVHQLTEQYDGLSMWTPAELSAIRAQVAAKITPAVPSSEQGLAPLSVAQTLRALLPDNTHLTVDTGQHKMLFAQAWQTNLPLSYFNSNGLSSMSTSVPGAIALAHANPELPVVSVSGDGGFAMMVQELETVNRLGITPLFVVLVDQALSLIRIPQQMRGIPSRGVDFAPVDWAMVAEGFGVRGRWARTQDELQAAVAEWVDAPQATVIAVRIDENLYCGNAY